MAVILSIIPDLLPLSPLSCLSSPDRVAQISPHLFAAARTHTSTALSASHPRQREIVAATVIRAQHFFLHASFVESWAEIGTAVALSWSAGLAKLSPAVEEGRQIGQAPGPTVFRLGGSCAIGWDEDPPFDDVDLNQRTNLLSVIPATQRLSV